MADYAGEDAWLPLWLRPILDDNLRDAALTDLLRSLELPLIDVLVELEYNGIKVDVGRLAELSRRYGQRLEDLEREIHQMAVNWKFAELLTNNVWGANGHNSADSTRPRAAGGGSPRLPNS